MARTKLQQLNFIDDQLLRSSTYAQRIAELKESANILSTLCDIPVAFISFAPDGDIDTWPDNVDDIKAILLLRFNSHPTEMPDKYNLSLADLYDIQFKNSNYDPVTMVDAKLEDIAQRIRLLGRDRVVMASGSLSDVFGTKKQVTKENNYSSPMVLDQSCCAVSAQNATEQDFLDWEPELSVDDFEILETCDFVGFGDADGDDCSAGNAMEQLQTVDWLEARPPMVDSMGCGVGCPTTAEIEKWLMEE